MRVLAALLIFGGCAAGTMASECDGSSPAHQIGTMVLGIQTALQAPSEDESLETITRYGTDSRYYVMIRGWLVQLLQGAESQATAVKDPELKRKHQQKVAFLKKAIRRIDLE